jgi:pilus assembly protein CpaD
MFGSVELIAGRSGAAWLRTGLVAALALAGAGCTFTAKQEVNSPIAADYRLRHPIAVREADRTMEVFVGMRRGELTPVQRAEVASFAQGWPRDATGGIIIDVPKGTPNARAAAQVQHEVRSILAAAGVPPGAIAVRAYQPTDPAMLATIRLNYPRMAAQAGPCGLWPDDLGPTADPAHNHNRPYWNFGCASQRNLAAMVDDPTDLVQPRAESPAYAARRSYMLDMYRRGQSTASTAANPNKGMISDVGR